MLPDYPIGTISSFTGAIVDIPTGWFLCDGNNGTPDLTNKFVVGAGTSYAVNAVGGNINHNHDFTGDGHVHDIDFGADIAWAPNLDNKTDRVPITGTTDNANGLPPYFAKAFIMFTS